SSVQIVFLCSVLADGAESRSYCPPGWSRFGYRCFNYFSSALSWADAEKYCLHFGANLVSIHSSYENRFVKELIRRGTGRHTRTWIGATDSHQNRLWFWTDGSRFDYSAWNHGEPNNLYGWGREQCVEINYGGRATFTDLFHSVTSLFQHPEEPGMRIKSNT
uniref:C-type lectin domain-containing protein n=1 Tax=Myripristis murdjan TaxID=586833 RepID=A0A667Z1I6_9TELE